MARARAVQTARRGGAGRRRRPDIARGAGDGGDGAGDGAGHAPGSGGGGASGGDGPGVAADVSSIRRFNRFYSRQIGLLGRGLLGTRHSLVQARILFELARRAPCTASELIAELRIDAGHLSRILAKLERDGLVRKAPAARDRRQQLLRLSARGRREAATLDARSSAEVQSLVAPLADEQRAHLVRAMAAIESLLGPRQAREAPVVLRDHRPGDLGWIVYRHGALYCQEYGWDGTFEALVMDIAREFARRHDPSRERVWIAEQAGQRVGAVMLVDAGDGVAQLRLLLVEPSARGCGVGGRLVDACVAFARHRGYRQVKLWTQSVLVAARRLYERAGFVRVDETAHHGFGHDLIAEVWTLDLA